MLALPLWGRETVPVAAASTARGGRTLVVSSFLTGAAAGHQGSFGRSTNLRKHLQAFMERSPGLCNRSDLHVVHDQSVMENVSNILGASLHYVPPAASMPPADRRWDLYDNLLRGVAWECAWAVDLTDVEVLRLPRCTEDVLPAASVAIASDSCSPGAKEWLARLVKSSGLAHTLKSSFLAFAGYKGGAAPTHPDSQRLYRLPLLNAGAVGGRRTAFEPALRAVADRIRRHYVPGTPHVNIDMVFWNELLLEQREHTIIGYPHGPVNLPMWGRLSSPSPFCSMTHEDPAEPGTKCIAECRALWANATLGHYWFAHKLQQWWVRFNVDGLGPRAGPHQRSCSG